MAGQWFYAKNDTRQGPVSLDELQRMARDGRLLPTDKVWTEGMRDWSPASQVGDLGFAVASVSPVVGYQQPHTDGIAATPRAVDMLRQTKPWVLFMAIICFIGAGLMFLGGIGMFIAGLVGGRAGRDMMVGIVYVPLGLLYIVPGLYLCRYSSAIARVVQFRRSDDLETALESQKSFWKFVGIATIVVIAVYAVILLCVILAFGAAAATGRRF